MDAELLTMLVLGAGALFGFGGSMIRAAKRGRPHQRAAALAWVEAAEKLGAELETKTGALEPTRLRITLLRDGAEVRLTTRVPVDAQLAGHTQASARYALGGGPSFSLQPRDAATPALGAEIDVDLAKRYRIRTEHPETMKSLLAEGVTERLMRAKRRVDVRSDGAEVEMVWDGAEASSAAIIDMAELALAIARFDARAFDALIEIEGAARVSGDGTHHIAVRRGPVLIALEPEWHPEDGRAGLVAVLRLDRELEAFEVEIDASGAIEGELPAGAFDPEAGASFGAVGPATLRLDEKLATVRWQTLPSLATAKAGVRLLEGLAKGAARGGAFR